MSFYFSIKDSLRSAVESASGGKATVMYDDKGLPCYMVRIPKFNCEDIDPDLGTGVHPAFIVDGVEKDEIWIGMFPTTDVIDGRAYCLPRRTPYVSITYDAAIQYCVAKGAGWHLMTVHEWAAVALWCLKNGFQPRGNTNYGRSHEAHHETGVRSAGGLPGNTTPSDGKTLTGSGPATWRHDGTYSGISDLVGNISELVYLLKLVDGQIYTLDTNDYSTDESLWVAQGVYFDSPVAGDDVGADNLGGPILSDSITNYAGTPGTDNNYDFNLGVEWNTLNIKSGWDPPLLMKQLCISPKKYDGTSTTVINIFSSVKGSIWVRNYGERVPTRGGGWSNHTYTGLAALFLWLDRSYRSWSIGFRPAYIA